ncbi:hypothetical protein GJU39_15955 [Pedobacter petrophilus]|uniref:Uncharacterized protein n=1 Tax=Pedobacter petrophilus TaxID=1908241 RepID=A0A7K0G1T9_9SPHI|nr:hypothetical protein [Pedobacter petrophilus]MRX77582.1 hypothetical protein [Pedobacter petrophilus]
MYKKIVLLLVFLVAISIQGRSQSLARRVTEAKREVMIASVEFLIGDSSSGKPIKEKECKSCDSYASIKKFAAVNSVERSGQLIDKWISWKIDTVDEAKAKTDLFNFVSKIDSSITSGVHSNRKQLSEYHAYNEKISGIEIMPPVTPTNSSTEISTVNNLKNDFQADAETPSKSGSWFYSANMLYGALGVIVLLLAFILFRNNNDQKKGGKLLKDLKRIREERDQLRHEIENLRNALNEVKALREEDKFELDKLKEELSLAALKQKAAVEEVASNTVVWDKPEAPQKIQETFYSRYADLVDGFSASELLTKEGNDTVFEITILSPNKASFKVSSNPAAQKYALSNADYFLEPTCHYDTLPSGTIINESPGSLTLIGGKWEIKEQAKISFR